MNIDNQCTAIKQHEYQEYFQAIFRLVNIHSLFQACSVSLIFQCIVKQIASLWRFRLERINYPTFCLFTFFITLISQCRNLARNFVSDILLLRFLSEKNNKLLFHKLLFSIISDSYSSSFFSMVWAQRGYKCT